MASFSQLCCKPSSHHTTKLLICSLPRLDLHMMAAEGHCLGYCWPSDGSWRPQPWLPSATPTKSPHPLPQGWLWRSQTLSHCHAPVPERTSHWGRDVSPLAGPYFSSVTINRARITSWVWGSWKSDAQVKADESYLSSLSHGSSPAFHLRLHNSVGLYTGRISNYILAKSNLRNGRYKIWQFYHK